MPEISVIVPVYRVEQYLDRCVGSILHQSEQNFELILVDDGSPDNCPAMCDAYAHQDSRIHVIHQKNGGLSAARNAGIDWVMAHSQSQWLAFVDSDDWIHRDYLQALLAGTQGTGAAVSVCGYLTTDARQEDRPLDELKPRVLDAEKAYIQYYGSCISAWAKLIRRDLMETLRFPVGKLYEDAFISHRLIFSQKKVAVFPAKLYYYYYSSVSITRSEWSAKKLDQMEAHRNRLQFLQEKGYPEAYEMEYWVYTEAIYDQVENLALEQMHTRKNKDYLKSLRKELRTAMKRGISSQYRTKRIFWFYLMAWHTEGLWYFCKISQILWNKTKAKMRSVTGRS